MKKQQTRRKFLIGGGMSTAVVLAGCSGGDSPDDDGGGNGGNGNQQQNPWQELKNTEVEVQEDEYQSWSWNAEQTAEIRWEHTVRSGPEVEIFMMESTEFDEFQAGNRFYSVNDESGTSSSDTFTAESGNYRFVIDNTDAGRVSPPTNFDDDIAEVEFIVEARAS
jgi:hypothetical protein